VNAPKLRFDGFEKDWKMKKIIDIAPLQRGFDLVKGNIIPGIYPIGYSNGILAHHNEFKAKGPGVFTGRSGTIGNIHYTDSDYWPHNTALWVTDFKDNYEKFIYYFYNQVDLKRYNAGSTVPTLNRNDIHALYKFIPKREEQEKIAYFFTFLDRKIEKQQEKIAKLIELKKGIMQKIFSQELRFKDEEGGEFGEWERIKLGKIAKVYDGTHATPDYVAKGIPFFSVENITKNNYTNTKFVSVDAYQIYKKRVAIEKNDILMTRIGSIGDVKLVDWDFESTFYVSLALIKPNDKTMSRYILQYIKTQECQKELQKRSLTTAVPQKINLGEISEIEILLPSHTEQFKISNLLSNMDSKIDQEKSSLDSLKDLKKGFMQQMFV